MSQLPLAPKMSTSTAHCTFAHPRDAAKVPLDLAKIKEVNTFCVGDKQDVTEVHNYLKHFGFLPVEAPAPSADGVVGEDTTTAIKAFQKSFDLEVDGTFGPETRAAMSEARCGFPDLLHGVDFSVSGPWANRDLKFAFGNRSRQPSADAAKAAIRRALDTWEAAGVGLTFREVATGADPDFVVEWRPAADPDHSMVGGVLAHADFPPGFSVIARGRPLPLHFDDEEHVWVDGAQANSYDIETIGLHELGHILGLYHSSVRGAVMFPTVSANLTKRTLTPDDHQAIRNLYPAWKPLGGQWSGEHSQVPPLLLARSSVRDILFIPCLLSNDLCYHKGHLASPRGPRAAPTSSSAAPTTPFSTSGRTAAARPGDLRTRDLRTSAAR